MPAGGGIIQIAAKGRQNEFLNANPTFTLFKSTHNRYTNFAEDFEFNDFNGVASFSSQKCAATISRYGDLITDLFLYVQLPAIRAPDDGEWNAYTTEEQVQTGTDSSGNPVYTTQTVTRHHPTGAYWVNAVGYALIEEVSIEIGSQDIDTMWGEWAFIWEELTQRPGSRIKESIGKFTWSETVEDDMMEYSALNRNLYIQLPFWFNKYFLEKGLAIPLISLTYHEMKVKVTFSAIENICCVVKKTGQDENFRDKWYLVEQKPNSVPINKLTGNALQNSDLVAKLLVCFIYLDTDERNAFSTSDNSYVITSTQKQNASIATAGLTQDSLKLYFNHPSNMLLWVVRPLNWNTSGGRRRYSVGYKDRFDFSAKIANSNLPFGDVDDPITNATLKLNGHERWPESMESTFFRVIQPQLKFENTPSAYIYVYVFAISGGAWNPNSTLNFSRIEHAQLDLKYNNRDSNNIQTSDVLLFVESYNLLLIKNGGYGMLVCLTLMYCLAVVSSKGWQVGVLCH
jgi:hypothetical protein